MSTSLLLLLPFLLLLHSSSASLPLHASPMPIKAAYWPSSTTYPSSSIDLSLFTHVLYAFVEPDRSTFNLVLTSEDKTVLPKFTSILHSQHPPLKALLSIGGHGSDPATFAALVSTNAYRSAFIASTITVAREYNLDGLELDWEHPSNPLQMSNLGSLFSEWRSGLEDEAIRSGKPRLLLTSAVYFASHFFFSGVPRAYPVKIMSNSLDFANIKCFDYHGAWETSKTGEPSALYDPTSNLSTSYGIGSWLASGMPAGKVVIGIPMYGTAWQLKDAAVNGVGAPTVAPSQGTWTGTYIFSEIVEFNVVEGATVVQDAATGSAYSYSGTVWIGFEDPTSVRLKVKFARGKGLGGYFFWAMGFDSNTSLSTAASISWES